MNVKLLCQTREDYLAFFMDIKKYSNTDNLWNPEDLPKLEPCFRYVNSRHPERTTEVEESYQFYVECCKKYADYRVDIRNAMENVSLETVADAMGIEDAGEAGYKLASDFPYSFPLVLVGVIDSGFDRLGNCSACFLNIVERF